MTQKKPQPADPIGPARLHLDALVRPYLDELSARSLVHELRNATGERKRELALDLLVNIAAHLHRRWPIPEPAMAWFSEAMVRIACLGENPEVAMSLRVSRGRRADQGVTFTRVAYMHALISWGVNKETAAGIVSRFVRVAEVTGLIKTYNRAAKVWDLQSPSLTDRRPDELEWRATARQFQEGRQVWVSIANPHGLASSGVRLVEDFRIYVVKEGVFRDMDRAAG